MEQQASRRQRSRCTDYPYMWNVLNKWTFRRGLFAVVLHTSCAHVRDYEMPVASLIPSINQSFCSQPRVRITLTRSSTIVATGSLPVSSAQNHWHCQRWRLHTHRARTSAWATCVDGDKSICVSHLTPSRNGRIYDSVSSATVSQWRRQFTQLFVLAFVRPCVQHCDESEASAVVVDIGTHIMFCTRSEQVTVDSTAGHENHQ